MASDTPCRPAAPVLVDHKHMPLLLAVPRLRRMAFRAAHGPVAAATQVLGAKPPCLYTFRECVVNHFSFCELPDNPTYRCQTACPRRPLLWRGRPASRCASSLMVPPTLSLPGKC